MLLVQHHRACKLCEPAAHLRQQMAHLEGHLRMRFVDRVGLCRLDGGGCGSHGVAPFHRISSMVWTGPSRRPSPTPTANKRLRNEYFGAAVSNRGNVPKYWFVPPPPPPQAIHISPPSP